VLQAGPLSGQGTRLFIKRLPSLFGRRYLQPDGAALIHLPRVISGRMVFAFAYHSHLLPVVREFLTAIQAHNIHACLIGGMRDAAQCFIASRKTKVAVPATE
jgi:hypothetical protein